MSTSGYDYDFYKDRHAATLYSARTILSMVIDAIPEVTSAVDFGCGVGTWLSVAKENGIDDVQGFDGSWVDKKLLEIPAAQFEQVNFEQPIQLQNNYGLGISLEVAEHISPRACNNFIDSLTHAADFILFSAAIPTQGGRGHVNERWPTFWADLFRDRCFRSFDIIRPSIWNDAGIPIWYRQNTLLYVKEDRINELNLDRLYSERPAIIDCIHPEFYLAKMAKMQSIDGSWRLFRKALKARVKQSFSR